MTRIIGGLAGSIQLTAPAKSTRPTSDRVRESIFNRLEAQDRVMGSHVLDLFAGTGALGLEAASRQASGVDLVELNRQASQVCQKNLATVTGSLAKQGLQIPVALLVQDAVAFASAARDRVASGLQAPYDLVFIDPPYEFANTAMTELLTRLTGSLNDDALVVVERAARTKPFDVPDGFTTDLVKSYGDTAVYWLSR